MDVRCEKCKTEYELDESKLKPGGVTVKCTACGHMFKVRRARATARGLPSSTPVPGPVAAPLEEEPTRPRTATPALSAESSDQQTDSERTWLIRLDNGEVKTCQELATLQKWIVAGQVTRTCEISRTGKKWKSLGEIGELISFFDIADEAREMAAGRSGSLRPSSLRAEGSAPQRERPPTHPRTIRRRSSVPQAGRRPVGSAGEAGDPPPEPARLRPLSPIPPGASEAVTKPSALAGVIESEQQRRTAAWASQEAAAYAGNQDGPAGPIGGMARGVATDDAAFARRAKKITFKGEFEDGAFVPTDDDLGDFVPQRAGAGKWIIIGSLGLIAAAALALYLIVFRDSKKAGSSAASAAADAGVVAQTAGRDAGVVGTDATGPVVIDTKTLVDAAAKELAADTGGGLELVGQRLAAAPGDEPALLVARAHVEAALAQQTFDEAAAATTDQKALLAKVRERAAQVLALAEQALAKDAAHAGAMVAKASALRLSGRSAREVERWLGKALKAAPGDREALLGRGLLLARDNRLREARQVLTPLASDPADVRPRYRLALLDFADKAYEAARTGADAVLSAQPEHAGAAALKKRIETSVSVVNTDPMPPEEGSGSSSSSSGGVDSYDRLLERGDRAAENGNCGEAMKWYEKALDVQPSGVAALTGLGYCHLDKKAYASAHGKFRAALGISSRYQGALWGIAEVYRQQGLKEQAIAAYKKYLDNHPSGGRASQARRMIEQLDSGSRPDGEGREERAVDAGVKEPGGQEGGTVRDDGDE